MISKRAKENILALKVQLDNAQNALRLYIQGVADGLGLEGKYTLNMETWEFDKADGAKQESVEK